MAKTSPKIQLITAVLVMTLTGCSVELPLRVQQSAPPDYRQLAADSISASFPITGAFFSDIKAAIAPQPADWFACVKLSDGKYFSVFYADGKVSEFRRAVGVDQCEEAQGYAPMPAPKPPNTKKGSKT